MLDDGHARLGADVLDQRASAARDDHVDGFAVADQVVDGCTVGHAHQLHGRGRQPRAGQALAHQCGQRAVGVDGFRATAQDGGIAGLQAQGCGIDGDVGARLVDDADHAQRNAHPAHLDAAGTLAQLADLAHRVGQGDDLCQPLHHGVDAFGGERQPVDEGTVKAGAVRAGQILAVGRQHQAAVAIDLMGQLLQRAVLDGRAGPGHVVAGVPGGTAQVGHVGGHVGCVHGSESSRSQREGPCAAAATSDPWGRFAGRR